MLDIIEVENQYYVRAQSSFADKQTKVLMSGEIFGVFDRHGDFRTPLSKEQGLYYREMRHLSRLVLRLGEGPLRLLSSSIGLDNAVFAVDLTNTELRLTDTETLRPGTLHFYRSNFLWEDSCYLRIEVCSYAVEAIAVELIVEFEADFADIFEVRGHRREKRDNCLNRRWNRLLWPWAIWDSTVCGVKPDLN